jgi:hypothetical protein
VSSYHAGLLMGALIGGLSIALLIFVAVHLPEWYRRPLRARWLWLVAAAIVTAGALEVVS